MHETVLILSALCLLFVSVAPVGAGEAPAGAGEAPDVNPFFEAWDTPFGVPPFDRIEDRHYLPAFEAALKTTRAEIEAIKATAGAPTFENTIVALDRSGEELARVQRVFFSLLSADTNDALDEIAKTVSPMLTKHGDEILLDAALFARIKAVYDAREATKLAGEELRLVEEYYKDFVRGGAELAPAAQGELKAINEELSLLTLGFGQNVLKDTNRFQMVLDDAADLAGLPPRVVSAAATAATEAGHEGKWLFTIHKPSLLPFLQYAEKRALRQKMFTAYAEQGAHGDDLDNRGAIGKIIRLRTRKAQLMGAETWAGFALQRRMAADPSRVNALLTQLWKPAIEVAKREASELQAMLDADTGGGVALAPWDWWFYAEKIRQSKYDLDENELRPYFELSRVIDGVFEVARRLYGIEFVERKDVPVYHPDVQVWEVKDADGSALGLLYTDYFPRKSKRGGAWCGTYRDAKRVQGVRVTPVVNNVGNFSKPTAGKPALLSFEEVETLFHEFGHALHVLFSDTAYQRTGDAVPVDFVELPSQIMENWARHPDVLKMYARHYETGAPIPDALVEKIERVGTFNQGFGTVEYLAASFLDMRWHSTSFPAEEIDVDAFEAKTLGDLGLIPEIIARYKSTYFRHIFSGGYYAAGYYSYIWAAVLDADAFEAFKEKGLYDRATAKAFREHILSRGGAADAMEMYRTFRGKDPQIAPLLKRRGLLPTGP